MNELSTQSEQHQKKRILIVDDEQLFALSVRKKLSKAGLECETAATLTEARAALDRQPADLILLDMRLPDGSGLDFLRRLPTDSAPAVVVLTAYGELEDAVTAMKYGARDYLSKPIDLDKLLLVLEATLERTELERQPMPLAAIAVEPASDNEPALLGDSTTMQELRAQLSRIAQLGTRADMPPPTVLIVGETGVGKDLAARWLHAQSQRRDRPFVHVDCAALPKDLIEAELFGHEKGAFTSAHGERTGLIEAAADGAVFLDEIAELPLDLQVKLLAVLERRRLRRVGSSQERLIGAWFIAATNRDLDGMVQAGEFRADLFYRLNVLSVTLPPLVERGDDVVLLARHYARQSAQRYGLDVPEFSADAVAALQRYTWPGNVRELLNVIERAVLLSGQSLLTADTLLLDDKASVAGLSAPPMLSDATLEDTEMSMIRQALQRNEGNVSEAARQLGITRMALRYRMQKYAIEVPR